MDEKQKSKFIFAAVGFLLVLILTQVTKGATFAYEGGFTIEAVDLKEASKYCYQHLTKGVYPGEEKGLKFIDTCANPKKL